MYVAHFEIHDTPPRAIPLPTAPYARSMPVSMPLRFFLGKAEYIWSGKTMTYRGRIVEASRFGLVFPRRWFSGVPFLSVVLYFFLFCC